jgi:hypothetical protein
VCASPFGVQQLAPSQILRYYAVLECSILLRNADDSRVVSTDWSRSANTDGLGVLWAHQRKAIRMSAWYSSRRVNNSFLSFIAAALSSPRSTYTSSQYSDCSRHGAIVPASVRGLAAALSAAAAAVGAGGVGSAASIFRMDARRCWRPISSSTSTTSARCKPK